MKMLRIIIDWERLDSLSTISLKTGLRKIDVLKILEIASQDIFVIPFLITA